MIVLNNIQKTYLTKSKDCIYAIKNTNLTFDKNEMIFILGQSGSGKTTLLNLLGGIDSQTSGEIIVDNRLLGRDLTLETYRQNYVGFVFQEYNLIDNLNVFDNIAIAISSKNENERDEIVSRVLEKVELIGYESRRINELSGGQKQRVAIARALAKNCQILLCDEPTGNLDSKTSREIFELLKNLSKEKIVIVVSHNEELSKQFADRILTIFDGKIIKNKTENRKANNIKPEIIKNKVAFLYKLKLSLTIFFTSKFKTFISFCLLFLSLFSVSIMQICCSYDSEKTIVNATKKESTIIIVNNKNSQDFALNTESNEIDMDLLSPIAPQDYQKLYTSKYGRFFITDDNNSIINNKEFYFKNSLSNNSAYITDFFADYTLKNDNNYQSIQFDNYSELEDVEIKYNGITLYKIAGVIKTDYQEFFDKNTLTFEKIDQFGFLPDKIENYSFNMNYKYNVTYVNLDTFNNFDFNSSVYYLYDSNNFKTEINVKDKKQFVSDLKLTDIDNTTTLFLSSDGFVKTNNPEFSNEFKKHRQIADNEAIINGELYNYLFNENINWVQINEDYQNKSLNNAAFYKQLEHLNTQIDFSLLKNGKNISNLNNITIVGVNFSNSNEYKNEGFSIYLKTKQLMLKNIDKQPNFAVEINLSHIDSAKTFFNNLRNENLLIAGAVAKSAYEKEYFIKCMSYFFIAITIIFTAITFLAMINLINTKIKDNKRQIGILMGIGFTLKDILTIFLLLISYLIILNVILIIPFTYLSAHIVNSLLMTDSLGFIQFFSVNISTFIVLCGSSLLLFIFSAFPLISFSKKKPIDIIKDEK